MPPKRKGDAKVALHRVGDGLRRLFRRHPDTKSNATPDICLSYTEWDGLERLSGILSLNVGAFGPLISTIGRFSGFVKMFENLARAREEYSKLGADLNDLFHTLAGHFDKTEPASIAVDNIQQLARSIDEETELLKRREDWEPQDDEGTTEDLGKVLSCYRRVRTLLALFAMNETAKMWRAHDDKVLNTRLELLPNSANAHYCAVGSKDVHRTGCAPNTRLDVLQDLREWIRYGKFQKVYWLNGIAGTGKTAIAYSLCESLENSGKPSASFFCSRDLPECRDVKRIFPSVSYQLARLSRPFRCAISRALEQDPEVYNRPIDEQFKRLIAGPLQNVGHTFGVDVVVVIDALEECEDKDGVNRILDACFKGSSGLPVRFLITSRQNPGILERMLVSQGVARRAELRLHEIDRTVAQEDVRTYLRVKLEHFDLFDHDIECLVRRSGGWFLYAASVVSYIGVDSLIDFVRLGRLLDISTQTESAEDQDIDVLYTSILEETIQQIGLEDPRRDEVMLVLRTTLCAQGLATINTVAGLLRIDFDHIVHTVLRPLLPALYVSNAGELGVMLSDSFASYLVDPQRSGRFYCDVRPGDNALITRSCFAFFETANVCNLESSYLLDQEVVGIDERAKESISQAMWYASRHWATHLKLAGFSDDLPTSLYDFLSRRLLIWMEVMNLKHHISEAVEILHGVHTWLEEAECPVSVRDLVLDAWRFVVEFSSGAVSASTPHIYLSALPFWPAHRPVAVHYMPLLRCIAKVTGVVPKWRGEDETAVDGSVSRAGHSRQRSEGIMGGTDDDLHHFLTTGAVRSVAYSPDGAYIASSCFGGTVRIWDTYTSKPLGQPPQGYVGPIDSVAYSPDGAHVASSSDEGPVRIWDAHTGQPVGQPLHGHTYGVLSVAYSPDGAYIASGSLDGTIRIWNTHTRQSVGQSLNGHTARVKSLAYSPNGEYITSGSYDRTVRIWDARTGQPVGQPLKHTDWFLSVAYSPDGAHIASGSWDGAVRIWEAHTGKPVGQSLTGHTGEVNSVAYSPDGAYIASGSYDKTIRIWDAQTGKSVGQLLTGHTAGVNSVTYSPNGAYIASGSNDETIRIWDPRVGAGPQLPTTLLQPTRSAAHNPNRSLTPSTLGRYITRISKKLTPAISSPHIPIRKHLLNYCTLDDQGWVVNAQQHRLIWVPQGLRELIELPPSLAIMPLGDRILLDFRDAKLGTGWRDCFNPSLLCPTSNLSAQDIPE